MTNTPDPSNQADPSKADPSKAMSTSHRILFVCLGNICRSPAAEEIFRQTVKAAGLEDSIHIESAGTGGYHDGKLPDPRMREAASKRGYDLQSRAQTIQSSDFRKFDWIIAMDRDNLRAIYRVAEPKAGQVHILSDFLSEEWPRDVPDPYYGGEAGFEYVLDMLEAASPKLLEEFVQSR